MTAHLLPDAAGTARAALLLRTGYLVAFGTETVYGLGANAADSAAVARIFAAKSRPRFNPLISHFPDAEHAFREVIPSPLAQRLAERFWPGPLTLVLPRRPGGTICDLACAGLPSAAVRVPAPEAIRRLLAEAGCPVAAPSANPSGRISPTTADHVSDGLAGQVDAILNTGPCEVGVESTVLDLSGDHPALLRAGGIPAAEIEVLTGPLARPSGPASAPAAPGQLSSHYAPALPVRLNATDVAADEALLAFGPELTGAGLVWNLSPSASLTEAASRLFSGLHCLDREGRRLGLKRIAAQPVPEDGLGLAILDRLTRAAAPRPDGDGV
ncbi:threonylcarbamoyl-AMP synthase [Acetobacter sp. AN02]|uniref:L-threonylcarbamoyladenylate synthase n=1 Tax=Acetobacter sp. AN02 TaxID=2894186 RepID=UPI0024344A3A|nr:L-threonylcarbamoyladenylate synthase [Acetobacter sp. AN02]MDG6095523.1 threonylcarbamoyl-AMP synthase [Acetobacter sp. AN02]